MEIIIRAVVVYVFLWLLLRGMGRRELAQMSAFEIVILVVIGDLVQQGVTQEDYSLTGAMLAVAPMALLAVGTTVVANRSRRARRVLEGVPLVVIHDGRFVVDALRHERVSEDEVREAARQNGIADLTTLEWAILEPNGKFSFLRRDERPGARVA